MWLDTNQPRSDRLVLTANPDHWNKERGPRIERAVFRNDLAHERAVELVCTTEGEVDIVTEVSPQDAKRVEDSEYAKLEAVDAMRVVVGIINRGVEDAPLDDARARRALNLAANRERVIREGFSDYAHPLAGLTPHYATGYPEDIEPYPYDPEEAQRLLSEAGWPEGRALRLAALADLEGVAELLAEDYRNALGIEVELTVIQDEDLLSAQHTLIEKVMPPPFDVLVQGWFDLTSDAPPAVLHREFYFSGGALRAGPPVQQFEELMGRFATQIDPEEQASIAQEIDRFVHEEVLSVFLCAPQALYAVNRHVDFVGYAATFELAETEVTEKHWSRQNAGGQSEGRGENQTGERSGAGEDGSGEEKGLLRQAAETVGLVDSESTSESESVESSSESSSEKREGSNTHMITLEEARSIISAAEQKAEEIGQPMNIAVMDAGRNLKAFARMENAWLGSIDIAINKAFTAVSFEMPTQDLAEMAQSGQSLFGIHVTNDANVVIFAGGIPLERDGEVVGAIGVSGGTVDLDQQVAEAGMEAF